MLAQSSDGVGARADVSPPTALVSQEVDAPRRILLLLLLLLSLVVDERVAVPLVLLVAVSVLRVEIHLGDRRAERAEEVGEGASRGGLGGDGNHPGCLGDALRAVRAGEEEVLVVDVGELVLDVVLDVVGSRPFFFVSNCVDDLASVNSSGLTAGLSMGETSR